jgi:hypothetical protein
MELSDAATSNAIELEITKEGLSQRANGNWQLKLTILAADMDQRLALAPTGTRYVCMLVEVTDDRLALQDHKAQERQAWRELDEVRQSGIRCKEPTFWAFLSEEMFASAVKIQGEESAARVVREHCGIESRTDLGKPGMTEARERWRKLDNKFQAWLAKETN